MSKYFIVLAAVAVLSLSGCNWLQKTTETPTTPEPVNEIGGAIYPTVEPTISATKAYTWETTTAALQLKYPTDYKGIGLEPFETKPQITEEIRSALGTNDFLLSLNDVYFTNEAVGIELPLRALFFDVSSEETVKKILPFVLSRSQMLPPTFSFNYQLGTESNVNFTNLSNPVKKFDVMKDGSKEGHAYLFRVAVEGQTSTFAVLFIRNYYESEYFQELDELITSSTEIGPSAAWSQKFGE